MPLFNPATITTWTNYTPTGAWSTNTSYTGKWRRVGDSMEIQVLIALAGAPTSATLSVNIPSGFTIDTNKLTSTTDDYSSIGTFMAVDSGTGSFFGNIAYNSTTSIRPKYIKITSASNTDGTGNIDATTPMTWANNDRIQLTFTVPIVGWTA